MLSGKNANDPDEAPREEVFLASAPIKSIAITSLSTVAFGSSSSKMLNSNKGEELDSTRESDGPSGWTNEAP